VTRLRRWACFVPDVLFIRGERIDSSWPQRVLVILVRRGLEKSSLKRASGDNLFTNCLQHWGNDFDACLVFKQEDDDVMCSEGRQRSTFMEIGALL
jgi:hypothetical protein